MKAPSDTTKYLVYAEIVAEGIVERPDVVGAIFGQTEGLLGEDLDLRELQKTGRIGRIEVKVESKGGKSYGEIKVPSSLDKIETAILAAALETIERVGPCAAKIKIQKIEDVRASKRRKIVERAKDILRGLFEEPEIESEKISNLVRQAIRIEEITEYGAEKLPAGPAVNESDAIIVVEGRADVLNLLRHGIKNVIAVEGTNIPKTIIELSKKKT
ncbi:DNA primase, partial [Archaeoglobales archaeon]